MNIPVFLTSMAVFFSGLNPVDAQNKPDTSNISTNILVLDLEKDLKPLDELMEMAVQRSNSVKFNEAMVQRNENNLKITERGWQEHFALNGVGSYGNPWKQSNSDVSNFSFLSGYRVGAQINFPISEFTSRGPMIKLSKAELEAAKYKKAEIEDDVRMRVSEAYYRLIYSQKILIIKSHNRDNSRLGYEMMEKRFKQGGIQIEEYTRQTEIFSKAEMDYYQSMAEFNSLLKNFELLVGSNISLLLKK
ncbi:MAG: TolC family protein [Cytophagales bacterium]|nr:TolC family protein [Cytophagales bacterium]